MIHPRPCVGYAAVGQEGDGGVDATHLGLGTHGSHRYPVRPDDADASVDLISYSIFGILYNISDLPDQS